MLGCTVNIVKLNFVLTGLNLKNMQGFQKKGYGQVMILYPLGNSEEKNNIRIVFSDLESGPLKIAICQYFGSCRL